MMTGGLRVPFVPTPELVVRRMLTLANVKPGELVYDLGAGDGRVLSSAARDFAARAVGVELHASRYTDILERVKRERLTDRVKIIRGDFFRISLTDADVVTLYLLSSVNRMIRPKLERELKPGTRVVSHDFLIRGWTPLRSEKVRDQYGTHMVYLYQAPSSFINRPVHHRHRPNHISPIMNNLPWLLRERRNGLNIANQKPAQRSLG